MNWPFQLLSLFTFKSGLLSSAETNKVYKIHDDFLVEKFLYFKCMPNIKCWIILKGISNLKKTNCSIFLLFRKRNTTYILCINNLHTFNLCALHKNRTDPPKNCYILFHGQLNTFSSHIWKDMHICHFYIYNYAK